jgi:hypothetical protein
VAGWVPAHAECGCLRTWWSSRRRLVDLVATVLRCWVLHSTGPFGVVLPALWLHFGTGATSVVFDTYLLERLGAQCAPYQYLNIEKLIKTNCIC